MASNIKRITLPKSQ